MNNKGQVVFYGIMVSLTIIILALALAPAGQTFIDAAMNNSSSTSVGLNCSSSTISDFDKGACVVTDYSMFYFFGGLILIGGAIVLARIIF